MNALVVTQYHWFLAALAAGVLVALAAGLVLARRGAGPGAPPAESVTRSQVLPHVMLLLVALAAATGVLLLLPAAMILRYIPGTRVIALLVIAIAMVSAPLVYAWRARAF